jgi:hypothetical protein
MDFPRAVGVAFSFDVPSHRPQGEKEAGHHTEGTREDLAPILFTDDVRVAP